MIWEVTSFHNKFYIIGFKRLRSGDAAIRMLFEKGFSCLG